MLCTERAARCSCPLPFFAIAAILIARYTAFLRSPRRERKRAAINNNYRDDVPRVRAISTIFDPNERRPMYKRRARGHSSRQQIVLSTRNRCIFDSATGRCTRTHRTLRLFLTAAPAPVNAMHRDATRSTGLRGHICRFSDKKARGSYSFF